MYICASYTICTYQVCSPICASSRASTLTSHTLESVSSNGGVAATGWGEVANISSTSSIVGAVELDVDDRPRPRILEGGRFFCRGARFYEEYTHVVSVE